MKLMPRNIPLLFFRFFEAVTAVCLLVTLILPWASITGIDAVGVWILALVASGLIAVLIGLFTLEAKPFAVIEIIFLGLPALLFAVFVIVRTIMHA